MIWLVSWLLFLLTKSNIDILKDEVKKMKEDIQLLHNYEAKQYIHGNYTGRYCS